MNDVIVAIKTDEDVCSILQRLNLNGLRQDMNTNKLADAPRICNDRVLYDIILEMKKVRKLEGLENIDENILSKAPF